MPSINNIIKDLDTITDRYMPQDSTRGRMELSSQELKEMDAFKRAKHELHNLLVETRESVDHFIDLRKSAEYERTLATIELHHTNSKKLKQASELWKKCKELLKKDEQRLDPSELAQRKEAVVALAEDIQNLTHMNTMTRPDDQRPSASVETKNEVQRALEDKWEKRRQGRVANRRGGRTGGGGGGGDGKDGGFTINDEDIRSQAPASDAEAQFMQLVEKSREEEDEILGLMITGMKDLDQIAVDIQGGLEEGKKLATKITNDVVRVNDKLRTTNQQIAEVMESSGGMSRWCPVVIFLVLLLALIGYLAHMMS